MSAKTPNALSMLRAGALLSAFAVSACSQASAPPAQPSSADPSAVPSDPTAERANKEIISQAYAGWAAGGTDFFNVLSDDVVWTILGNGPSAITYRSKAAFLKEAVAPFSARLSTPLKPTVRGIYTDGDQVIALWDGEARTRDGQLYRNTYTWFFTMRDGKAVEVKALLDLNAYDRVIAEVVPAPAT